MKKKLFIIAIIIIIIGIFVVGFKGFNVNYNYKEHKLVYIPSSTNYELNDIKQIANGIFENEKVHIKKTGIYEDSIAIIVNDISNEQLTKLKDEMNNKYQIKQKLKISIGKEDYNVDDIKAIAKEVLSMDDVNVTKLKDNESYVEIETGYIVEEDLETLNQKINEKYGLSNEASSITENQVIKVTNIPRVRLIDMAKQYGTYVLISAVLIILYFAFRYAKVGIKKTVIGSILTIIICEFLYMSIIAITRCPIDKLTIMGAIAIYIVNIVFLDKMYNNLQNKKI